MLTDRDSHDSDEPGRTPGLPWPALPPWHDRVLAELARSRATLPHALLLHGPRGIGKHALALHVARNLLCEMPDGRGLACGKCEGCRYVVAGQHPDLMRLELLTLDAETDELAGVDTIAIDRVRALIEFVQLTAHRRGRKVAVVAPAERMNLAAANALLKTLEEPPPGTHLLLVSDQPGRLPATIVSRCRKLSLALPAGPEVTAWLHERGIRQPELVLAQAGGAPLSAVALSEPEIQLERKAWLTALAEPRTLSVVALANRVEQAPRDERKARLGHALEWMLAWCSDLAREGAGAPALRNPDFAAELRTLAPKVAGVALFRYHRAVLEQRTLLVHPLQPRLVAESVLLGYLSLFNVSRVT